MKILQLCKKFPYPPKDGEAIAILNLTTSLASLGHEVTVLAMNTQKHYFDIKELPDRLRGMASFHSVDINTDIKVWDALRNLFSSKSYHIERFVSVRFKAKLLELLTENRYDVIHLETIYLASYIPHIRKHSNALVSLRAHNVEHEIWERLAHNQKARIKKWYLKLLTKRLKKFERSCISDCDLMVPISARDERAFRNFGWDKESYVLPTGIDLEALQPPAENKDVKSIFFIGGMDWLPNLEGVKWFLEKVWKKLKEKHPDLVFYLAGRNMPQWMIDLKIDGLKVRGEVEDAHAFMTAGSLMVVPLFSGSGMRIKIIEAMALSKAIVSTTIGAEGIAYENGENILIADDEESFVEQIELLIDQEKLLIELGKNARALIESKYDNVKLTKGLIEFYQKNLPV